MRLIYETMLVVFELLSLCEEIKKAEDLDKLKRLANFYTEKYKEI